MEISSSLNYSYVSVPSKLNCDDCSKVYEENDTNDDGQLSINEIGSATSLSIVADIPEESIETEKLQEDLLNNYDKLQNNQLTINEFNDFLKENDIKTSEELAREQQEIEQNSPLLLSSALFEIQQREESDDRSLSSYANMMDKVNAITQTPQMNDMLQAFTQNLRN